MSLYFYYNITIVVLLERNNITSIESIKAILKRSYCNLIAITLRCSFSFTTILQWYGADLEESTTIGDRISS